MTKGLHFATPWNANRSIRKVCIAAGSRLLVLICSSSPSIALNGLINVSSCTNCQTSADFAAAAAAQAESMVKVGLYIVTSLNFQETAYVRVNGSVRLPCNTTPCTIQPGEQPVLTNVTTSFVDVSGNSLAGQSEATLEAAFLAIDQTLYVNFRSGGPTGGKPIQIPPAISTTPINSESWDVDANTGINNVLQIQFGVDPAALPLGTLVSVQWQDGTTATFIRTNSVATLLWVYVPGSMRDKNGKPITPISGSAIANPNTAGPGSGAVQLPNSPIQAVGTGVEYCQLTVTLSDGSNARYVYIYYVPC